MALGPRWLAYAEHRLLHSKRSGGGCDSDGVPSYTATMLNAAKSLSKGLRELGEQVAAGLTGTSAGGSISKNNSIDSNSGSDAKQPGIITIIDIKVCHYKVNSIIYIKILSFRIPSRTIVLQQARPLPAKWVMIQSLHISLPIRMPSSPVNSITRA